MTDNFKETKVEYPEGHQVIFLFYVRHIDGKLYWHTVTDYETNCRVLKTSWLLEIQIQKVDINGEVYIPFTLKRNDTRNRPVQASIMLSFTDANNRGFFDDVKSFEKKVVMPGDKIRNIIGEYIELPERRSLFNEELLVSVVIGIGNCHLYNITNPLTSRSIVRKKKLCSMM